jgi:hypothetical protein
MIELTWVDGQNPASCTVFVGAILRKHARKSLAEFFLLANSHCVSGNETDVAGGAIRGHLG